MNTALIRMMDGTERSLPLPATEKGWTLEVSRIPEGTAFVEFHLDEFRASAGDDGYFLIPTFTERNRPSGLTRFRERPDMEHVSRSNDMPVFGINRGNSGILAVVSGMGLTYSIVVQVKNGCYTMFPRFHFDGGKPYEAPEILRFDLTGTDADYSGMARRYRRYQIERGACIPLRERAEKYPVLAEAAKGAEVRIRMAWKPVPPPVLEQTEENEPEVHAAITFRRAGEILDECYRQGIRHAEFCLVGWNIGGHDGRFPDLFPVEPKLGTLDDLKALIAKAKGYGYLICCHTNVLDSYSVSKRWRRNDLLLDRDGSEHKGGCWGGGQSYFFCPKMAHEHYAVQDFDDLAALGFRGTHYLDVMSIVEPNPCYHPDHPLNPREAGDWRGKTMALAREKIGASGSEGGLDFMIGDLDYVLYALFELNPKMPELCDEYVPFWFIVYHGIVLYNSSCESVNAMIKRNPDLALRNLEYGGRPLAYFYAKFLSTGSNWMGNEDMGCATDGEMRNAVSKLAESIRSYSERCDLQYEFLEEHKKLADRVALTRYSDGSVILVNYRDDAFLYEGKTVPPHGFLRIRK